MKMRFACSLASALTERRYKLTESSKLTEHRYKLTARRDNPASRKFGAEFLALRPIAPHRQAKLAIISGAAQKF